MISARTMHDVGTLSILRSGEAYEVSHHVHTSRDPKGGAGRGEEQRSTVELTEARGIVEVELHAFRAHVDQIVLAHAVVVLRHAVRDFCCARLRDH